MADANTFRSVASKYHNSPIVILIFVASFAMLVFGINNFAEDVYSSYLGIQEIEMAYGLNVQIWTFTYWVMSASFQVATIVFFFLFMSTGERKFMWITFAVQFVDFFADAWYRSNGQLFKSPGYAVMSGGFTFVFFTIGSEVFITIGFGLVLALFAPALNVWKREWRNIETATRGSYSPPPPNRNNQNNKGNQNQSNKSYRTDYDMSDRESEERAARLRDMIRQSPQFQEAHRERPTQPVQPSNGKPIKQDNLFGG